jgi:hypothetical protein
VASVFGKLTTTAKAVALGAAVIAALVFFFGGPGATGWLIAAAAGSLAWPAVSLLAGVTPRARGPRTPRTLGEPRRSDEPEPSAADAVLDEILAKISREGLDALTPAERERLEAARRAKLRRPR